MPQFDSSSDSTGDSRGGSLPPVSCTSAGLASPVRLTGEPNAGRALGEQWVPCPQMPMTRAPSSSQTAAAAAEAVVGERTWVGSALCPQHSRVRTRKEPTSKRRLSTIAGLNRKVILIGTTWHNFFPQPYILKPCPTLFSAVCVGVNARPHPRPFPFTRGAEGEGKAPAARGGAKGRSDGRTDGGPTAEMHFLQQTSTFAGCSTARQEWATRLFRGTRFRTTG